MECFTYEIVRVVNITAAAINRNPGIRPFKTATPCIAIPGLGDRVFSMTQDDELVLSIPGEPLLPMYEPLNVVGKKVGLRYPVPGYLNYQPEFPPIYKEMAEKLELF